MADYAALIRRFNMARRGDPCGRPVFLGTACPTDSV